MNTRLQVEHTVTEMVTGLDLVREQVWIAGGRPLGWTQADVRLSGHSIQCRINAEDPAAGFVPTPGTITRYREPSGPGRADRLRRGRGLDDLGPLRPDDREARRLGRGSRAGSEAHAARPLGARDRGPEDAHPAPPPDPRASRTSSPAASCTSSSKRAARWVRTNHRGQTPRRGGLTPGVGEARTLPVEVDGKRFEVTVTVPEHPGRTRLRARRAAIAERERTAHGAADVVRSPMQGTVLTVGVAAGDTVSPGDVLVVVEAMKMENEIVAHGIRAWSRRSRCAAGDQVLGGQALVRLGARRLRTNCPQRMGPRGRGGGAGSGLPWTHGNHSHRHRHRGLPRPRPRARPRARRTRLEPRRRRPRRERAPGGPRHASRAPGRTIAIPGDVADPDHRARSGRGRPGARPPRPAREQRERARPVADAAARRASIPPTSRRSCARTPSRRSPSSSSRFRCSRRTAAGS